MRFRLNPRGVEQVVESAGVTRYLDDRADRLKAEVEDQASRFQKTRHFAGSIRKHRPERTAKGQRATVDSDDFAAHLVEFGSANNPPYAPFRKAASSMGLRLRGGGERR